MAELDPELAAALAAFARPGRVLIALDFDGVIAPLVDDPSASAAPPATERALQRIARVPDVRVAYISGRGLDDLLALAPAVPDLAAVGSHGAELRLADGTREQVPADPALVTPIRAALADATRDLPGVRLEGKPLGVVVHTRTARPNVAGEAATRALEVAERFPDAVVRQGRDVVEFAVAHTTKGDAVRALRERLGVDRVLFAGDDVTDEDALAVLGDGDVGIKVGAQASIAPFRILGPDSLAPVLDAVADARS